jgi:Zn-dependent protease with chaperone function
MTRLVRGAGIAALVALVAACAGPVSTGGGGGASTPQPTSRKETKLVRVDRATAERLQSVMVPLLKVMNNPLQPSQVKVGIMDDPSLNAASAGNGEFLVTTGLLQKASDAELRGVMAHEIAHQDLNHVQKTQALGTGLTIGMIILDQIIPGSGNLTPIAGELLLRRYTRGEEFAADEHGVQLLQRAGHPGKKVMADTLTWLQNTTGGSAGGFFATHPATGDRIQAVLNLPGP